MGAGNMSKSTQGSVSYLASKYTKHNSVDDNMKVNGGLAQSDDLMQDENDDDLQHDMPQQQDTSEFDGP